MASYQNSAGNKGITSEYDQWRYFNSSIKQLGDYRASRLNTKVIDYMPKQATDWMKSITDVTKGALGLFEMRRQYSYEKADEWLSKHSLEEYHDLMKKGNVPFQDDPLAMQRLKFRHGEILADIAQKDFQSRIDKGEFLGKEPEEIDAENFNYMNQVLSEDTDVYPYKADGDWFFNQGFWANSNKFRQQVFAKSRAVNDDYNKQQAIVDTTASLVKMIEGGANAKQLVSALNLSFDAYGWHFKPVEYQKIVSQAVDQLSLTPWGDQVIDELKDMKVPTMGNTTFKDILGGDTGIQKLKLSSTNIRYNNDMSLRRSDRNNIERLIESGSVEDLQNKADEIRAIDGGDSDRFKLHWNAVAKAQTQREKLLKERAKAIKEEYNTTQNLLIADEYVFRLLRGDPEFMSDNNKLFWNQLGMRLGGTPDIELKRQHIDEVFEDGVRSGRIKPTDIATMANRTYDTYNPAREWINKNSTSLIRNIQGQVNGLISNPKTEVAPPDNLESMLELYRTDPSAFGNLDKGDTLMMQSLCHAIDNGIVTYDQAVRSMSWYASQDKDSKDLKTIKNKIIKRDVTKKLEVTTLGDGGAIDNTPMLRSTVQTLTGNYMLMGLDVNEAMEKSIEQINDNFYQVGNNMVPKRFFNNNKLTLDGTMSVANGWAKDVEKELSARHLDFSNVNIWYNKMDDSIGVYDSGSGEEIMSLTKEDLERRIDKEADNITIRVKKQDEQLKSKSEGDVWSIPKDFKGTD